jgi:hypothetical protein
MAKGGGGGGAALLPVSADAGKGDGEPELFKGSAMTRRGAVAALSYMSCSGEYPRSAPLSGRFPYTAVELARCICVIVHGSGGFCERVACPADSVLILAANSLASVGRYIRYHAAT